MRLRFLMVWLHPSVAHNSFILLSCCGPRGLTQGENIFVEELGPVWRRTWNPDGEVGQR